jgi:tRNA-dihydrouridine synthase B
MIFRHKLFLAPMAGITEPVFRTLCRENGADAVVSEMVSAEGVFRKSKKTRSLIEFNEIERPIGIQIFGSHPEHMAYCAAYVEEHYHPDFIDLNSGCPVPKVVCKNGGAALLRDAGLFGKILYAMVRAVSTPITVKLRSGWALNEWVDVQFAKIAQDCGVAAVILHPRSKTMMFSGHSFWDRIAAVKSALSIPVIGNGDVCSGADAKAILDQTGCDGVMIGRAALGNPWIFGEARCFLSENIFRAPSLQSRFAVVTRHLSEYRTKYGDKKAVNDLKKHLSWYCKGLPRAAFYRKDIFHAKTMAALEETIRKAFHPDVNLLLKSAPTHGK